MEGRAMTDLKEQTSSTVLKASRKEHMLERGWVLHLQPHWSALTGG